MGTTGRRLKTAAEPLAMLAETLRRGGRLAKATTIKGGRGRTGMANKICELTPGGASRLTGKETEVRSI